MNGGTAGAAAAAPPPSAPAAAGAGPPGGREYCGVRGQIPTDLLLRLARDFSEDERVDIFHRIHLADAERGRARPTALFVLGPSAVGKSTVTERTATKLFGSTLNAVLVDGAVFREVHRGWIAVARDGLRRGVLHEDAWDTYKNAGKGKDGRKKGYPDCLKQEIINHAVRDRQHLIIPDTASDRARLEALMQRVANAGYEMHLMVLWAPLTATQERGVPRSMREGKKWSDRGYTNSTQNGVYFAQQWMQHGLRAETRTGKWFSPPSPRHPAGGSDSGSDGAETGPAARAAEARYATVSCYDNSVFPSHLIGLAELRRLTGKSREEAEAHLAERRARQELVDVAGVAMSDARAEGKTQHEVVRAGLAARVTSALSADHPGSGAGDPSSLSRQSTQVGELLSPDALAAQFLAGSPTAAPLSAAAAPLPPRLFPAATPQAEVAGIGSVVSSCSLHPPPPPTAPAPAAAAVPAAALPARRRRWPERGPCAQPACVCGFVAGALAHAALQYVASRAARRSD